MNTKPAYFWVNHCTGAVELRVTGSLYQGRLEKKVRAVLAALPKDSFEAPPKALWRLYYDCDRKADGYELNFVATLPTTVEKALFALQLG